MALMTTSAPLRGPRPSSSTSREGNLRRTPRVLSTGASDSAKSRLHQSLTNYPEGNGISPFCRFTENEEPPRLRISAVPQRCEAVHDPRDSRDVPTLLSRTRVGGGATTRAPTPTGTHVRPRKWVLAFGLLVLQLAVFASPAVAQFHGENMRCEQEGEPVPVPPEVGKDKPCISCVCENHIVVCNKKRCPSMEGCYWKLMTTEEQCCQECKGCVHEGYTYKHGSRWSDGCQHYECQSGVLTTSQKHCHVPCYSPLPPLGNGCCPRCEGCWLEGRRVPEGEVVSSRGDPCVRCVCSDGRLTCEKRSCPVLSCFPSRQVLSHDGCCMTCQGSRPMISPPGGRCFLNGYLYPSGEDRTVDSCTECRCHLGYITCERRTCPVLSCAREYQVTRKDECCPTCTAAAQLESVCNEFGTIHKDGDTWQLDQCSYCSCNDGKTTCQALTCEYANKPCPPGYRRVEPEHECCPRCEKAPGVCVVFGDPHYRTFDGMLFNFQGVCKYWLAKTCKGKDFSLKVINDARRSSHFSWTKSLSLRVPGAKITLGQNLRIRINGEKVKAPVNESGIVTLKREGQGVSISTPKGIRVLWDGGSYVEVEVPVEMRGTTCGLCGNFNGNSTDDLSTKDGRMAVTTDLMAMSWATGKARKCSDKMRAYREEERNSVGSPRSQRLTCLVSRSKALEQCGILNSTDFQPCHATVPIDKFYEACILDMCECKPTRRCECDTLQAYARECQRLNTPVLNWRSRSKCGGLECPRGAEYMDCAPPCRATCRNQKPNPSCYMRTCKKGCFCPTNTVLYRGACIPPSECPKRGKRGTGIAEGTREAWLSKALQGCPACPYWSAAGRPRLLLLGALSPATACAQQLVCQVFSSSR